jgi:hypothetical protein
MGGSLDPLWEIGMQGISKNRGGLRFLTGPAAVVLLAGLTLPAARAQDATTAPTVTAEPEAAPAPKPKRQRKAAPRAAQRYYVEFRARNAASYGHTFALFGRLNAKGDIADREVAGLHPATDSPVPWMIGHVVPVRSETGPSDGDLDDQYMTARYRVELDEAEYQKTVAFIRNLQNSSPVWHAVFYNCNAFVADIAKSLGLKTPASTMLFPADFINTMRELNSGERQAAAETFTSGQ